MRTKTKDLYDQYDATELQEWNRKVYGDGLKGSIDDYLTVYRDYMRNDGDYTKSKSTNLYRLHGGEYCCLLEVLNEHFKNKRQAQYTAQEAEDVIDFSGFLQPEAHCIQVGRRGITGWKMPLDDVRQLLTSAWLIVETSNEVAASLGHHITVVVQEATEKREYFYFKTKKHQMHGKEPLFL